AGGYTPGSQSTESGLRRCEEAFNQQFFEYFEGFSEHGIFHGITNWKENKPLKIRDKKGLFTIEWE
ncbi:MAG: hypothetical protein ABR558_11115, partial [Thioalkalivibrio sp.]